MPRSNKQLRRNVYRLKRILIKIREYLNSQYFYPRRRTYLDATVLTLLSKSLALARSAICLVENGFSEEAFGTSRTLLELALNLRYITNGRSPEIRAKRFVHFVSKVKMEWGRIGVRTFAWSPKQIRKDMPNYQDFRILEKKYPRQSWIQASKKHAKGIWTMAMEPDRFEKVPILDRRRNPVLNKRGKPKMKPFTWEFDYKVIYFWTSQYVHVTIESLDNHAAIPDKVFRVYSPDSDIPRRTADYGDMTLFNVALYMHKILVAAFRGLGRDYPEELSKPLELFLRSSAVK